MKEANVSVVNLVLCLNVWHKNKNKTKKTKTKSYTNTASTVYWFINQSHNQAIFLLFGEAFQAHKQTKNSVKEKILLLFVLLLLFSFWLLATDWLLSRSFFALFRSLFVSLCFGCFVRHFLSVSIIQTFSLTTSNLFYFNFI